MMSLVTIKILRKSNFKILTNKDYKIRISTINNNFMMNKKITLQTININRINKKINKKITTLSLYTIKIL